MTARPELLGLIRHAKDDLDDVPRRLVLADWLEEHGDEADLTLAIVQHLSLQQTRITSAGWRMLGESPYLGSLHLLSVTQDEVPPAQLVRVRDRFDALDR
jgi:uncharacterized protein (TIGR02996 family)